MKKLFLLVLAALFCITAFSQTREKLYNRLLWSFSDKDTARSAKILSDWEKLYPQDAQLYAGYANLYLQKSLKEVTIISEEKPEDEDYDVEIDSLGNEVYTYTTRIRDSLMTDKRISTLEEGISKFPDRLDFRISLASTHWANKNNREMVDVLCKIIERSRENGNNWLMTLDEKPEDGEATMFEPFQSYFSHLFLKLNEIELAESLADTVLKYYPNNTVFLNNKAGIAYDRGDYDTALKNYLKSHEIAPNVSFVLLNIAYIYEKKKDKANALKYYKLLEETGDELYAPVAKKAIAELENGKENKQSKVLIFIFN